MEKLYTNQPWDFDNIPDEVENEVWKFRDSRGEIRADSMGSCLVIGTSKDLYKEEIFEKLPKAEDYNLHYCYEAIQLRSEINWPHEHPRVTIEEFKAKIERFHSIINLAYVEFALYDKNLAKAYEKIGRKVKELEYYQISFNTEDDGLHFMVKTPELLKEKVDELLSEVEGELVWIEPVWKGDQLVDMKSSRESI